MPKNKSPHSARGDRPGWAPIDDICQGIDNGQDEFITTDGFCHEIDNHGYRLSDFPNRKEITIMTLGCSFSFGYGLELQETWSALVSKQLSTILDRNVANWNLARPGGSNDLILRQVVTMSHLFRPDILLIGFTHPGRHEFWMNNRRPVTLTQGAVARTDWDEDRFKLQRHFEDMSNPCQSEMKMYVTMKCISALLASSNTLFVYTYARQKAAPQFHDYCVPEQYVGELFPRFDFAGDGQHPGKESNKALAVLTVTKILEQALNSNNPSLKRPISPK